MTEIPPLTVLPYPGYRYLIAPEGHRYRWYAYRPAEYLAPTQRMSGTEDTQEEALAVALVLSEDE